jgi:hypothetical protein
MKLIGVALAGTVTFSIVLVLLRIVIWHMDLLKDSNTPFLDKSTFEKMELLRFCKQALPLLLSCVLDNWMWEQMTLAAGLISINI